MIQRWHTKSKLFLMATFYLLMVRIQNIWNFSIRQNCGNRLQVISNATIESNSFNFYECNLLIQVNLQWSYLKLGSKYLNFLPFDKIAAIGCKCNWRKVKNGKGDYSSLRQHSRQIFGMDHLHEILNPSVYHISRSVQSGLRTLRSKLRDSLL